MSRAKFDDECPGCRPCILDPVTRQILPESHPLMKAMRRVWSLTTAMEREAFHRVTCNNSRNPVDMAISQALVGRLLGEMDRGTMH